MLVQDIDIKQLVEIVDGAITKDCWCVHNPCVRCVWVELIKRITGVKS